MGKDKALNRNLKDREKVKKAADKPRKLRAWVDKSDSNYVHVYAIYRLGALARHGDAVALASLRDIAANSSNKNDRCEAALYLPDQDEAKQAMAKVIRDAVVDSSIEKLADYHSEYKTDSWFYLVGDNVELMMMLYDSGSESVRSRVENSTTDQNLMKRIIMELPEKTVIISDNIAKNYQGTQDDWEDIARNSKTERARNYAIGHLELMTKRTVLEEFAKEGNVAAQKRLLQQDPNRYVNLFVNLLSLEQLGKAIDAQQLDQDALERLCSEFRPNKDSRAVYKYEIMGVALDQLRGQGRVENVFQAQRKSVTSYIYDNSYEQWLTKLVDRVSYNQRLTAEFLMSQDTLLRYYSAKQKALEKLDDQELLMKIACSNNGSARDAVTKVKPELLGEVAKTAKTQAVCEYAQDRWDMHQISSGVDDNALLEMLKQSIERNRDKDWGKQIVVELKSQEAMLKALSICGREHSRVADEARKALLPQITDGDGLMKLILAEPEKTHYEPPRRLRELIDGTDLERFFIDENVRRYKEEGMSGSYMWILSKYLDQNEMKLIWKYCGKEYIYREVSRLENTTEYDSAQTAIHNLVVMYRNVPESAGDLEYMEGKRYTKHMDFVANCASDSRNENVTMVVELK